MAAPLVFAVEFATDAAKASLSALASAAKAATVDIATNILAPVSPANLITQVAQQGLGLNALSGNLIAGGVGALRGSRFGYLAEAGEQFNAENSAINQTIAQARAARLGGLPFNEGQMDYAYRLNYQQAIAQERVEGEFKQRHAQSIASSDISKTLGNGTRLYNQLSPILGQGAAGVGMWAMSSFPRYFGSTLRDENIFLRGLNLSMDVLSR